MSTYLPQLEQHKDDKAMHNYTFTHVLLDTYIGAFSFQQRVIIFSYCMSPYTTSGLKLTIVD